MQRSWLNLAAVLALMFVMRTAHGQNPPDLPPLPPGFDPAKHGPIVAAPAQPPVQGLPSSPVAPQPAAPVSPPVAPVQPPQQVVPSPVVTPPSPAVSGPPMSALAWDAVTKEYTPKPGETATQFTFSVTNTSDADITIQHVMTSCGCTTANLPQMPWKLAAGTNGQFGVSMNFFGKFGTVTKTVSIFSTAGTTNLFVTVHIPQAAAGAAPTMSDRARNQQIAAADRQAVFKNDCASCHAAPTAGKTGEPLYVAACAICHDAPHRASMVPDLRALPHETNADFWKMWVTHGKPGTLMPAFAQAEGGPLTKEQIESLVEYLAQNFKGKTAGAAASAGGSH